MKKIKYALVLGGGGANGAYQIGAWKALRELKIEFNAIIGNSVGALNAGFIAMNKFNDAEKIWENLTIDKIVKIPEDLFKKGKLRIKFSKVSIFKKLELLFKNKGLDTEPLKQMIESNMDEKKIRKSGIDFGIITYQLNDFKPLELFLDDIKEGKLADYLIASSSIPVIFKSTELDGKKLIDGGIHDNIPFNLAKERGYKNIIVIDISGLGVTKKPNIEGTNTIYIKNSMELGNIIDFDPDKLKKYIKMGYLDTLKIFNRFEGIKYFYQIDLKSVIKLKKILFDPIVINNYKKFLKKAENNKISDNTYIKMKLREILPKSYNNHKEIIVSLMECACTSLKIELLNIYKFKELLKTIWKKYLDIENKYKEETNYMNFIDRFGKKISSIKTLNDIKKMFNLSPFEYEKDFEIFYKINNNEEDVQTKMLANFYPEIIGAKIFLIILKKYFKK
ncbi:MAG: patatin-like phospholipase family protein [Spirochaetes bacterium]|nr:patatin-like phospholipase family protein [Spirochaetota bacterium]